MLEKAIEYHTKAIELSPDNFNYYISRGVVELDLKKNDDAIKDFSKAIELKPDFSLPYFLRGICLSRQGKYKQALNDGETAHSMRPSKATKKFIKEMKKMPILLNKLLSAPPPWCRWRREVSVCFESL